MRIKNGGSMKEKSTQSLRSSLFRLEMLQGRIHLVRKATLVAYLISGIVLLTLLVSSSQAATAKSTAQTETPFYEKFFASYFAIFDGPSVTDPMLVYQPSADGAPDPNRPVLLRNFFTLGYEINPDVSANVAASMGWTPEDSTQLAMRDPYFRLAHNSIFSTENFNFYGDVRLHFPITLSSRVQDMLAGFQTFHMSTYAIPDSRLTAGLYTSARFNVFGAQGFGNDLELYLGPNFTYTASRKVALTLLLELFYAHDFQNPQFQIVNTSTELEPGLSWDVSDQFNVSPFLNIPLKEGPSLEATSFGFTVGLTIL